MTSPASPNPALAQLRAALLAAPPDWDAARAALAACLAETPDALPLALEYAREALALGDQFARLARLEAVAHATAQADLDDAPTPALREAIAEAQALARGDGPQAAPWAALPRERLEALEALAAAAPAFGAQHGQCWRGGQTYALEVERPFRAALAALGAAPSASGARGGGEGGA